MQLRLPASDAQSSNHETGAVRRSRAKLHRGHGRTVDCKLSFAAFHGLPGEAELSSVANQFASKVVSFLIITCKRYIETIVSILECVRETLCVERGLGHADNDVRTSDKGSIARIEPTTSRV